MSIRIFLLLILVALPIFLSAELLLKLAMPGFSATLTMLGSAMLLSGFIGLAGAVLLGALNATIRSIWGYFSSQQRALRRLWFVQARQEQIKRLFYFRARQVKYFGELKRKRLLRRNNHRHIRSLSQSIDKDLITLKAKLPKTTYQQLQQDNIRYRKQQDIEALLQLQQRISTLI